jgi:hypothetical protein
MWKRLALCAAVVAIGSDAAAQTPAQITATTSGGLNTVTITSTTSGVNADIGTWSGNPYVYPAEPRGCTYFYVDVNVNDGGTLSFKFNQRTWGGIWDAAFGSGSPDEDWLDVYLLTPGTTWNPGTATTSGGLNTVTITSNDLEPGRERTVLAPGLAVGRHPADPELRFPRLRTHVRKRNDRLSCARAPTSISRCRWTDGCTRACASSSASGTKGRAMKRNRACET